MTVRAGPNQVIFQLEIAQFRWPRTGARMAISLKSLYQVLGLNQFSGQQWHWLAGSWHRWRGHVGNFGLGEHVLAACSMEAICPWRVGAGRFAERRLVSRHIRGS